MVDGTVDLPVRGAVDRRRFHHCQVDDATIGLHYMWDWIADALNVTTAPG
jgi:hypothetical protein